MVNLDNRDNQGNQGNNKHQGQGPRLRTMDQVLPQVDRLPQEGTSPSMGQLTHLVQVLHHLPPVDINLVVLLVISLVQLGISPAQEDISLVQLAPDTNLVQLAPDTNLVQLVPDTNLVQLGTHPLQ